MEINTTVPQLVKQRETQEQIVRTAQERIKAIDAAIAQIRDAADAALHAR